MTHRNAEYIKAWVEGEKVYYQPLNSKNWLEVGYLTLFDQHGINFSFEPPEKHLVDKVLDNFDFYKVRTTMAALNWTYFDEETTPSIDRLRETAKGLLEQVYMYLNPAPKNEDTYSASTGGFVASGFLDVDGNICLTLKFVAVEAEYGEHWE